MQAFQEREIAKFVRFPYEYKGNLGVILGVNKSNIERRQKVTVKCVK